MLSKSTPSYVSIHLLEAVIYTEPNSITNNVIRGTLKLTLPKTTTVKCISVRFCGNMETKKCAIEIRTDKTLALEHLVLYPATEKDKNRPLIMNAGLTQFGFEMQVPSNLPESIDCPEVKVDYQVTAVMEYYGNSNKKSSVWRRSCKKQMATQVIGVARLPSSDILMGDSIFDPIDSRTHKSTWLDYQIIVNKKAISLGSQLPITFRFMPVLESGVSIDRVSVQMLEKRSLYHGQERRTSFSVYSILPTACCNKIPSSTFREPWEGTIGYKIPTKESNNMTLVHSTQEYSDFNVNHTLLVSISLSVPGTGRLSANRVRKILTFQTQIDLLSEMVSELDSLKLPTYDSPPPFDNTEYVFGEYDRKFADPPAYCDIVSTTGHHHQ